MSLDFLIGLAFGGIIAYFVRQNYIDRKLIELEATKKSYERGMKNGRSSSRPASRKKADS